MSDTPIDEGDGTGGTGRGSTAAQRRAQQNAERELRERLERAMERVSDLEDSVVTLGEQLLESTAREEAMMREAERAESKYEALMRDVILGSALDGLSESLHNLDSTLEARLAPLAVLNTLTTAGSPVGAVDVRRFEAVQDASARINADTYVVRRATTAEEAPGQPTAESPSAY
jgi:chromosome segregation ATPase